MKAFVKGLVKGLPFVKGFITRLCFFTHVFRDKLLVLIFCCCFVCNGFLVVEGFTRSPRPAPRFFAFCILEVRSLVFTLLPPPPVLLTFMSQLLLIRATARVAV